MVPVLVGFVFLVPRLPGDGGAAFQHVAPTAVAFGRDEFQRFLACGAAEQAL